MDTAYEIAYYAPTYDVRHVNRIFRKYMYGLH